MSTPQPQFRYQVVSSDSPDQLASQVSNFLNQGWSLRGDIVVLIIPGEALSILYVQVLVR